MEKPSKPKKKFSIFPWDWDSSDSKPPTPQCPPKSASKSKSKDTRQKKSKAAPKPAPRIKKEVIYDTSLHQEQQKLQQGPSSSRPPSSLVSLKKQASSPTLSSRKEVIKASVVDFKHPSPSTNAPTPEREQNVEKLLVRSQPTKASSTAAAPSIQTHRIMSVVTEPEPELDSQNDRSLGPRSLGFTSRSSRLPTGSSRFDVDDEHDDFEPSLTGGNDLTFEKAVLALIRLRRLEARLLRTRDRYVKEMGLFRGWDDERYVYVLDQIAKSNHRMDELDPLIASLEAFIKEDQTPSYLSEDQVLRYPISVDQRTRTQRPTNYASKIPFEEKYGQSVGRRISERTRNPNSSQQLSPEELEQEVEELRQQVRKLQLGNRVQNVMMTTNGRTNEGTAQNYPTADQRSDYLTKFADKESRESSTTLRTIPVSVNNYTTGAAPRQTTLGNGSYEKKGPASEQSSDELSVEVNSSVDRYEDFNNPAKMLRDDLRESFSKLDDLMREMEEDRSRQVSPAQHQHFSGEHKQYLKREYSPAPIPNTHTKPENQQHVYANSIVEGHHMKGHQSKPTGNGEIRYDFDLRLESPDQISIPERYLDGADGDEDETAYQIMQRQAKAESIRRRLAQPEFGGTERDQRQREKVLLMTPILARQVKERSRVVAMQAKKSRNQR